VSADRDSGHREREHQVEHDDAECTAAEDVRALSLEHDGSAQDAEDRAGGSDRDARRCEEQGSGRAGEARDEVEQEVAAASDCQLNGRAEPPESEHVEGKVNRPVVEKRRGEEPPPVPRGDRRAVESAFGEDPIAGPVDVSPRRQLEQVDTDVHGDEDLGDDRAASLVAGAADTLFHACRPLRLSGVVGAADADRREDHAVRADRAAAFRARDHRLPVGVAVAVHRLGHRPR
jgi:hypothetical protein